MLKHASSIRHAGYLVTHGYPKVAFIDRKIWGLSRDITNPDMRIGSMQKHECLRVKMRGKVLCPQHISGMKTYVRIWPYQERGIESELNLTKCQTCYRVKKQRDWWSLLGFLYEPLLKGGFCGFGKFVTTRSRSYCSLDSTIKTPYCHTCENWEKPESPEDAQMDIVRKLQDNNHRWSRSLEI